MGSLELRGHVLADKLGLTVCVLAAKLLGGTVGTGCSACECLPDVQPEDPGVVESVLLHFSTSL